MPIDNDDGAALWARAQEVMQAEENAGPEQDIVLELRRVWHFNGKEYPTQDAAKEAQRLEVLRASDDEKQARRIAYARDLRRRGYCYKVIAGASGVSQTTARKWTFDADGREPPENEAAILAHVASKGTLTMKEAAEIAGYSTTRIRDWGFGRWATKEGGRLVIAAKEFAEFLEFNQILWRSPVARRAPNQNG